MTETLRRFITVTIAPEPFFEAVREEADWRRPLVHLVILSLWLSVGSMVAWALGVRGDTPINAALGAQMDVYAVWHDTLLPDFGFWSYPIGALLIAFEMWLITAIYTPLIFLVFRYLGGERLPHGLLHAFQGFVYGLSPAAFGGFVPGLALVVGVYTTILQLQRGPAITLRNRTLGSYLLWIAVMAWAIARYWQHQLL